MDLTQVLVADDGTKQTRHLFGTDLLYQEGDNQTRYLLSDGLGSVRTQMVGNTVDTVSTFGPYGNLLVQTGSSGTVYGFTGEQEDAATGLVYLRARYYNPYLNQFMGRDPWRGDMRRSQSMNGWSYASNNPVNFVDPTGYKIWRSSSSRGEKIVEWLYERKNPSYIHVEFDQMTGVPGVFNPRVDILNSFWGDIYEIEPLIVPKAIPTAIIQSLEYQFLLTYFGGGGKAKIGNKILPGLGVLPYADPNNWNVTSWDLGDVSRFPPIVYPSHLGPVVSSKGMEAIPPGFDFIAVSPLDGVVLWWIQPNSKVTAAFFAAAAANSYWKQHIVKFGDSVPPVGGVPVPTPVPVSHTSGQGLSPELKKACGVTLITIGGVIIIGTLVENILTGGAGVLDDPATGGVATTLIKLGQDLISAAP